MEIEVRFVVERLPRLEHGEREAVPLLDVQCAFEKIVPLEFLAVERHRYRRVPRHGGRGRLQRLKRLVGFERHAGAVRFGRGVVGKDIRRGLAFTVVNLIGSLLLIAYTGGPSSPGLV